LQKRKLAWNGEGFIIRIADKRKVPLVCPAGSHYHLINSNCQEFVQKLSDSIERTPETANMTERATTNRFGDAFGRLIRSLGYLPEEARRDAPESVRQYIERMARWLLMLLRQNAGRMIGAALPYLIDISWPVLDGIFKMLGQAGSYMFGGAGALLDMLINAGFCIWEAISQPAVVAVFFGGVVLYAVWQGAEWFWTWFRNKAKDVSGRVESMELQQYVHLLAQRRFNELTFHH
jgi:hypothetical protein